MRHVLHLILEGCPQCAHHVLEEERRAAVDSRALHHREAILERDTMDTGLMQHSHDVSSDILRRWRMSVC